MRGALAFSAAVGAIVGCGFNAGAPNDGRPGAGDGKPTGDGGQHDAAIHMDGGGASSCLAKWENGTIHFGAPTDLGSTVTTQSETHPFLTSDELQIYFARGNGNTAIYAGKRSSTTAAFQNIAQFSPQPTVSAVTSLSTSSDGLTLIEAGTFGGGGGSDWVATRATTGDPWGPLDPSVALHLNANNLSPLDPFLVGTGLALYFAPIAAVGAQQGLAMATRPDLTSDFVQTTIPGYDGPPGTNSDGDPWVDANQQLLLFGRVPAASTHESIMYAIYDAGQSQFGTATAVVIDGSDAATEDPWLSPDYCRLYLSHKHDESDDLNVAMATAQ